MIVLGIETSCDETAAAIVDGNGRILSHVLHSQIDDHAAFGGVVPEVAARAHLNILPQLIEKALEDASVTYCYLDGVAAVAGPGLIGGVMVGLMTAKGISAAAGVPLLAVNHLEAHALTVRLTDKVDFPYLLLLVSGGHSDFYIVKGVGAYTHLGGTIDDAVGECFDKVARLLNIGFPGGAKIEALAKQGNSKAYDLPKPLWREKSCRLSLSGLKTSVAHLVRDLKKEGDLTPAIIADVAASLQATIADVLHDRSYFALDAYLKENPADPAFVVAGGVAANQLIRTRLQELSAQKNVRFIAPPLSLCTDNAVMVAWAGIEMLKAGRKSDMNTGAYPRWPLNTMETV